MPGLITGGYTLHCRRCEHEILLPEESLTDAARHAATDGWVGLDIRVDHMALLVSRPSTLCPTCAPKPPRSGSVW